MAEPTGTMDDLIGVINDLQAAFAKLQIKEKDLNLNLPRIAVVGSQSSGKSSVLESFVGKDFLPRGSNIVTRCPLVLQLVQAPPESEEFGEFSHKTKKFTDFLEIRTEIENRTKELAGDAVVCDVPIALKITSPHVLNLTLIDLPGLVTNAVKGQPETIVKQIRDMVLNFILHENTIILAVSSAAEDIANSKALDASRTVDPEGRRTLGVLTKLDLMDKGTNALQVLNGELIRLRHGFIGVVNRSQQDINKNVGMDDARVHEKQFFLGHEAYSNIANRLGTPYLAKRLNGMLLHHIQECIPKLKGHVDELMKQTRKKQEKLGMLDPVTEPSAMLLQLISQYTDAINRTINGDVMDANRGELFGGARIDYIFHECYAPYVISMKAGSQLPDDTIRMMVRTCTGLQSTLFPSDQVVIALTKQQIHRLEDPSLKCVGFVHDELARIIESCSTRLERFPLLKAKVVEIMMEELVKCRQPCIGHIKTMIAAEEGYINVKHPAMQEALARMTGMYDTTGNIQQQNPNANATQQPAPQGSQHGSQGGQTHGGQPAPQQRGQSQGQHPTQGQQGGANAPQWGNTQNTSGTPAHQNSVNMNSLNNRISNQSFDVPHQITLSSTLSDKEQRENNSIRDMVEAYFCICQRTSTDQVPKIINLMMIAKLRQDMYHRLVQNLYQEKLIPELLAESSDIAAQRKATLQMMKCLTLAQDTLARVRDHPLRRG